VKRWRKCKRLIENSIFKDSFQRDVLVLLVVSVLIGSLVASAVSYGANAFFSQTLSSLVGDYGEYDVVIQVREDLREDTAVQLQKIIDEALPGSRLVQGPTAIGKTAFFVSLPEEYKTKEIFESLDNIFASIPGGGSVGVMTEPRITIRGVPEGAKNTLIDQIARLDGVRFVFRDGASIGVIAASLEKAAAITDQIEDILDQYQVLEISFPFGSEPINPLKLGEDIAKNMQSQLGLAFAQNVSVDGQNSDISYMVSTMVELKRFLSAYAAEAIITPAAGVKLAKGDIIAFAGKGGALTAGNAPAEGNVLAQVTGIRPDGTADAIIIKGDASYIGEQTQGYKVANGVIGGAAGTTTYTNPREKLSGALTETAKLVGHIPDFAQDARNMSSIAITALDNYGNGVSALDSLLTSLQSAGGAIEAATGGLANINTSALQGQLNSSAQAIGGVANTLRAISLLQGSLSPVVNDLANTQHNLESMSATLVALDNAAAKAREARAILDGIVNSGRSTVATLRAFDVNGARANLANINGRLDQVQQIDTALITAQLQYLAAAVPNLTDEEINHSVRILDQFIAGQVIPSQRIQILTSSNINTEAVAPIVYELAGHQNVSLYSTAFGVIEPNARGELMAVLMQVREVLAAIMAIIATILFLLLDHTAIMSVMRRRRLATKVKHTGWRGLWQRLTATYTAPERQYGFAVGAFLLTAMFILADGGLPYVPWLAVPFIGGLIGVIVANNAEKISPMSTDEIMAGQSLGLSEDEIMREIVIPSARPGLLQKINSRKVKFK